MGAWGVSQGLKYIIGVAKGRGEADSGRACGDGGWKVSDVGRDKK